MQKYLSTTTTKFICLFHLSCSNQQQNEMGSTWQSFKIRW